MARYRGTFSVAANYEPLTASPFDARELVDYKLDLIDPATWEQENGDIWIYTGMIVSVAKDTDENNGVYQLRDRTNYTNEESWYKLADSSAVAYLQEQIDALKESGNGDAGSSADIEVGTFDSLPAIGMSGITYFVRDTKTIYRWNTETFSYDNYGGGSVDLDNIEIIHGGDSNG